MIFPYLMGGIRPYNKTAGTTPGKVRVEENVDANGNPDGTWRADIWAYNNTGDKLTQHGVYCLQFTGAYATNPQVVTPVASGSISRSVAVADAATASGTFGWVRVAGWVDALVNGSTAVAASDNLKLAPATQANAFIKESALNAQSTAMLAVAQAAQAAASNVKTRVYLTGFPSIVNT